MANIFQKAAKATSKVAGFVKNNAAVVTLPILGGLDKVGVGPTKGLEQQAGKFGIDVNALTGGKNLGDLFTNIGGAAKKDPTPVSTIAVPGGNGGTLGNSFALTAASGPRVDAPSKLPWILGGLAALLGVFLLFRRK